MCEFVIDWLSSLPDLSYSLRNDTRAQRLWLWNTHTILIVDTETTEKFFSWMHEKQKHV